MEKIGSRGGATAFAAQVISSLLLLLTPFGAAAATGMAGRNCTRSCGGIDIPYPFGVEPGCYHAAGFNLTCSHQENPPKLFLGDGTATAVQVLEISVPGGRVRVNGRRVHLDFDGGNATVNGTWGGLPRGGPYILSESAANRLVVVGCGVQVDLRAAGDDRDVLVSSCTAVCPYVPLRQSGGGTLGSMVIGPFGNCTGIGCCDTSIALGYSAYNLHGSQHGDQLYYKLSTSAYITDGVFNYSRDMINGDNVPEALPATLDWIISSSTCPTNASAPECRSDNSVCRNTTAGADFQQPFNGYVCSCSDGYQGNPYILGGCQDIDECRTSEIPCYGDCKNTVGSYICTCPSGYTGNASIPNGCKDIDECKNQEAYSCYGICQNSPGSFHCQCPDGTYGNTSTKGGCVTIKNSFTGLSIGLGVGGGTSILLLALGGPYIMRKVKLQKVKKMKQNNFKKNHGLLLQQLISLNTDIGERMIITLRDIEKATNNFDSARVIGGGGHGVVFKGILDLHVVAIKKSKIVVQREISEFINEVAVLSQVNHRNVVKLLGCCLETEVPLLVYEFISNGTLCHHLHVEGPISLSWYHRMRIATEVAKALSYLHSSASMPIFHRDVKSSNILLDDALTAKVSDFGASRYIPTDRTGVTTAVQGTMGYLDPMYYYTGRLTDKSDVFSFGVLLIELLTRKKPYVYRSVDDDGLVSHFVSLFTQGKLVDIIDPQVMEEEDGEIQEIATLAATCTKLKGEDRPTMREVEMALESLLVKKRQVPYKGTPTRNEEDETIAHYMSTNDQASRQYTMEEEMLLSASYPR
ncbi:wall-associated receptor kinase 2-like [Panicum virgatum]|nr:wall-associated receptor kinase 2-like [Panicum virgatum]